MKTLILYINTATYNLSFFNIWAEKTTKKITINSPENLYNEIKTHSAERRIKRLQGQQWGDDGGVYNYTIKKAQNDFNKFSKEETI